MKRVEEVEREKTQIKKIKAFHFPEKVKNIGCLVATHRFHSTYPILKEKKKRLRYRENNFC